MSNKLVSLSRKAENIVSMREFFETRATDNTRQREMINSAVQRAIKDELTEKQRRVFLLYYASGKNISTIAYELDVNKSTIARHLKIARDRLRRLFSYTMIPLDVEDDLRSSPQ